MANNNCKFYKVVRQVSYDSGVTWVNIGETQKGDLYEYDSAECGAVTQYRWVDVTGAYTCEGTTKYQKTKRQVSTDGGTTWQDVSPAEYGKGNVIEYYSEDCGGGEYSDQYLTFVALEDVRFKFNSKASTILNSVSYSLDGGSNWTSLPNDTYTPMVQTGQKIMWKGGYRPDWWPGYNISYNNRFCCTGRYNVEGNIMSLLYGDNFIGKISLAGTSHIFSTLFVGNFPDSGYLVSAENLVLPATTLGEHCYDCMFWDCALLTKAPALPATTLAANCYQSMFSGCYSLTTAPALPATTLADGCYFAMFEDCTSLTTAPELPAQTLVYDCYLDMFRFCSSLNYIKCLATDTSAHRCTWTWVEGVSSSGTFVKASGTVWGGGVDGIPTNWTIQNA